MTPWQMDRPRRKDGWVYILAGALLLLSLGAPPALSEEMAALTDGRGLFGKVSQGSSNLSAFPKWTGTLARYFEGRDVAEGGCEESFFTRCHLKEWRRFLEGLRGKSRHTQLEEVNRYINHVSYLTDPINYGVPDYWAVPDEHLNRRGDCEDYAIAKFLSLRELGFSNADLRIVVLQDLNLRIPHAVLAVYLNDQAFVLDNQINVVVPASGVRHYQPVYSVNETHWWLYLNP
ncbi:MAG: transglutaminase-like cysteine peptidase [Alphaproteobacteria bacterium]|nr:transglutaminase-like cysteine peptidase [Alphaproteobacteria bacterium]